MSTKLNRDHLLLVKFIALSAELPLVVRGLGRALAVILTVVKLAAITIVQAAVWCSRAARLRRAALEVLAAIAIVQAAVWRSRADRLRRAARLRLAAIVAI